MIREAPFDKAEQLIDALTPQRSEWGPEPRDWLFRGQRDASWPLAPSVYRDDALRDRFGLAAPGSTAERVALESRLLRRFTTLADVQGLPTLADPEECDLRASERWIPTRLLPQAALAQHYGVPTRLLDWTRRPLVGAWFAAEGAARQPAATSPARLAVWALRRTRERKNDLLVTAGIRVVRAPRASNRNLHLQSGLFTVSESDQPLNRTLDGRDDLLFKMTLPVSEAPRLLWFLAANFVQGATVYAGYEGVTRSLEEEHLRRR